MDRQHQYQIFECHGLAGAQEDCTRSGGAGAALIGLSSPLQRSPQEHYIRPEEQVLIDRREITSKQDAWDVQEFITRMYVKQLLRHWAFQLLLAMLLVTNAITIALRTNSVLHQKHYELFSTIDDIVLTILICEVLLGWLNGFWIFWKDGWNILNFLIIFTLFLGFFISELNVISITYTLRVLRLLHVCMAVEPLARIIRVILQSVPDMANIMALILFFMLVFSVFGVTLFGASVPKHFENMPVALYTLFICITQDGWVVIYEDFQLEIRDYAMEIGGALYFATFITIGAFIGINLLVVVVTTNLELMVKAGEQGQQNQLNFTETVNMAEYENYDLPLVHCVVARMDMSGLPQEPLMGGPMSNLSENTCDNFCLVLEAIQENLMQYKEIRDELNTIVEEVRSIRFNQEQEEALLHRHVSKSLLMESRSSMDIREMTSQQDLLTALVTREKVQESATSILNKQKSSR
ncbi:LOW QUALITY PROTEIN: cation channel sperm-associated protein 4 [Phyllostomus discolor]|uniref:LOW QUALITY PROTEIN: cation channel sperm-associated protein 4 n=1 Tax=Phyllostomus discolor TaxID=89673 RepID=A0A6J2LN82_9CHIR|nr:LOW QUALITY PROTEIN: cation channel sperm-associated protein 4 [Phyllostomus discolor]